MQCLRLSLVCKRRRCKETTVNDYTPIDRLKNSRKHSAKPTFHIFFLLVLNFGHDYEEDDQADTLIDASFGSRSPSQSAFVFEMAFALGMLSVTARSVNDSAEVVHFQERERKSPLEDA